MECSAFQLIDLPDELLLIIFQKLNYIDAIYSLDGINMRLNKIICDQVLTTCLTLFRWSSDVDNVIYPFNDTIIDRFRLEILPKIHYKIKWLNIESSSMERILRIIDYPNLHGLGLYNIEVQTFKYLFIDETALTNVYKYQISKLIITMTNHENEILMEDSMRTMYNYIFIVFPKLHYLNFCSYSNMNGHYLSFDKKSSHIFSLTLTELNVNLKSFEDCVYLLDGRFNQLCKFSVNIRSISTPFIAMNDKKALHNLRYFSLICDNSSDFYEEWIVPLLHRMLNLEELTLYLGFISTPMFIDGNNLKKNIISHLPRLNKFLFNICSVMNFISEAYLPSNEEIQQTFVNFMNNKVISRVDYFPKKNTGHCHIYSDPYTMNYFYNVTNYFPGGLFKHVREVSLFDENPFEHDFFLRIAQSFPLLKVLSVNNRTPQKRKQCRTSNDDNQDISIIKYFHLIDISLICVHSDYVEQFLDPTKTSISNNTSLTVDYYRLRKATRNFKRNDMRINCSKLINLRLYGQFQLPKHFKAYFPHVKNQ